MKKIRRALRRWLFRVLPVEPHTFTLKVFDDIDHQLALWRVSLPVDTDTICFHAAWEETVWVCYVMMYDEGMNAILRFDYPQKRIEPGDKFEFVLHASPIFQKILIEGFPKDVAPHEVTGCWGQAVNV